MNSIRYENALAYAKNKHDGQFRIGGLPYVSHPIAVSDLVKQWGYSEDFQLAALFHDLLEDTDATEEEILFLSNENVLNAVKLLTKEDGYVMKNYIANIKNNEIAFVVKTADRVHNLKCAIVANEDFKKRYIKDTVEWFLDFSEEIHYALRALANSLNSPMTEYPFLYEPIENWKID